MFDSSLGDNQQYADGGMVAFAAGDEVLPEGPLGPYFEEQVRALYPDAIIAGRGRTAARNRQVGGVPNSYHRTNDALDLKPPKGMSLTEFGSNLRKHFGPEVDTIFNTKGHHDHVHLEPSKVARRGTPRAAPAAPTATPAGLAAANMPSEEMQAMREQMRASAAERAADKKDRRQAAFMNLAQQGLAMMSPEGAGMPSLFADGGTVPGYAASGEVKDPYRKENVEAEMARLDALAPQSNVRRDKAMAILDRETSDEYYRTERKQSANMALMNFGLALMATKNPNFLGALGESGAPAVAGMKADLNALKKEARAATFEAAQLEGFSNKEAREKAITAEAGITRAVAAEERRVAAQTQASQFDRELADRMTIAREGNISSERNAATSATARDSTFDRIFKITVDDLTSRLNAGLTVKDVDGKAHVLLPGTKLSPDRVAAIAAGLAAAQTAKTRGGAGTSIGTDDIRSLIEGRGGQQAQGGGGSGTNMQSFDAQGNPL
jgi:hypothetical protein